MCAFKVLSEGSLSRFLYLGLSFYVPLGYGALNVTGGSREGSTRARKHRTVVHQSRGSVAVERSYRAFGALVPNYSMLRGACPLVVLSPMLVLMFFFFLVIVPISHLSSSFASPPIPYSVPKRRSQQGVVGSRA